MKDIYDDQNKPNSTQFLITGIIGIIIFSGIFIISVKGIYINKLQSFPLLFFTFMILLSCCELPRYIIFVIKKEYVSDICYAFHILGGIFFFASLTVVCFIWHDILEVGEFGKSLYGKKGLLFANLISTSVMFYSFCACVSANSLSKYFHSDDFQIFIFEEIIQTLLYSFSLFFFGIRLLIRINLFSKYITKAHVNNIVLHLIITLGIVSFDALMRLAVCLIQVVTTNSNIKTSNDIFPRYGVLWFIVAEFFPRGLSSVVLIIFMSRGRQSKSQNSFSERLIGVESESGSCDEDMYVSNSSYQSTIEKSIASNPLPINDKNAYDLSYRSNDSSRPVSSGRENSLTLMSPPESSALSDLQYERYDKSFW